MAMASLCARSARGFSRTGFRRGLAPLFSAHSRLSSDYQASSSSWLVSGRSDGQSPPSLLFTRTFCAPDPVRDSCQPSSPDSDPKETEAKPAADKHSEEKQEFPDEKTEVLRAALLHVPKLGWSEAAMVAGARDVGLSPAIVGGFPRKEAALVEFFMDECHQALLDYIESHEDELTKMLLQERLTKLVQCRLEMQASVISRWAQALSIQANPANLPTSFKQRAVLVDEIWHAAGDHSSNMDWYAKRGILAAVYTGTELYMLTDHSPGFRDTWTFLQRRVKDSLDCRKTAQEASQIAQAIGVGLGNTLQGLFRR